MYTGTHAMKSGATRLAVVWAWLFALTVVLGLIAGNAAIAMTGRSIPTRIRLSCMELKRF